MTTNQWNHLTPALFAIAETRNADLGVACDMLRNNLRQGRDVDGDTTTLQNLAISVLAQTIALGMDSWEAAKKRLTDITVAIPLALEEVWKDKETDNAAADKSTAADAAQNTMQEA